MKVFDFSNLPQDPETSSKIIDGTFEESKSERELGKLGLFFGSGNSVKMNIAGLLITVLVLTGIGYTLILLCSDLSKNKMVIGILDFWNIITPLITLALGYVFGKQDEN